MKRSISTKSAAAKDRQQEIDRILGILRKWGIYTLGQLAALDKEQLGARLGPEAIRLWERANGKTTRLLKLIQPPEAFEEIFEFENEIETIEPLLFMLRRFLQQLGLRLGALYLVAKELKLRITFADPPRDGFAAANKNHYEHRFKIPEPTNNIDILFRMLHTHLENFKSDFPIVAILLEAEPAKPSQQQFGLFETSLRDPGRLYETLARLVGLLGADRVGTPVLEETHRPDAFRMEPFAWNLNTDEFPHRRASARAPLPEGEGGVRATTCSESPHLENRSRPGAALRRFRSTVSASVLLTENKPVHFRSTEVSGKVSEQSGPYMASGNWWDEKSWARAEWDLQLDGDVLLRCHQSPPSVAAATSGVAGGERWEVDGIYD